jgi:hypothetical protein
VLATSGGVSTAAVDTPRVVPHATCLGCGCACDDIEVVVVADRIVEARRACPLGVAWFGDGSVPARAVVEGGDVTGPLAIDAVARLLLRARRPLVYLAPELSCEAQREAVGLADGLRALLDTVSTDTVLPSILAMQERGRASATLGEVRNRADVLVWWGVDPDARYPAIPHALRAAAERAAGARGAAVAPRDRGGRGRGARSGRRGRPHRRVPGRGGRDADRPARAPGDRRSRPGGRRGRGVGERARRHGGDRRRALRRGGGRRGAVARTRSGARRGAGRVDAGAERPDASRAQHAAWRAATEAARRRC